MAKKDFRVEKDSMGELKVPAEAMWGAQTQRAVKNFPVSGKLVRALSHLAKTFQKKGGSLRYMTKTGRTHLMDAMPVRFDQELGGWAQQINNGIARIKACGPRIQALAQGGTAVGTGINAPPDLATGLPSALTHAA